MKRKLKSISHSIKWQWQKLTRGYSDYEVWELHSCFVGWILPRLKAYRHGGDGSGPMGYPGRLSSYEEWLEIVDEMIWAFTRLQQDESMNGPYIDYSNGEWDRVHAGQKLFGEWMGALWD